MSESKPIKVLLCGRMQGKSALLETLRKLEKEGYIIIQDNGSILEFKHNPPEAFLDEFRDLHQSHLQKLHEAIKETGEKPLNRNTFNIQGVVTGRFSSKKENKFKKRR